MTFSFEVRPDLESFSGMRDVECFAGYKDVYDDEDFRALGVDPRDRTDAKPGSDEKVLTLAARYAAGLPLWHSEDCYDHGPDGENDLEGDEFEEA